MTTEIYLPRENSLKISPLVSRLGYWLAAWRSGMKAEARPVDATSSTSALDTGRTLWVDQPMAREVSCTQGTLWLTFDGVRKDIILEAGRSYRCDCASRLGIHAIDAARFEMT